MRGIRERQVHEYPSLENILEAVVDGKEQGGYVSAARGSWLAATRWPGKLEFVRAGCGRGRSLSDLRRSEEERRAI